MEEYFCSVSNFWPVQPGVIHWSGVYRVKDFHSVPTLKSPVLGLSIPPSLLTWYIWGPSTSVKWEEESNNQYDFFGECTGLSQMNILVCSLWLVSMLWLASWWFTVAVHQWVRQYPDLEFSIWCPATPHILSGFSEIYVAVPYLRSYPVPLLHYTPNWGILFYLCRG